MHTPQYTTDSTVPDRVRPGLWKDWKRFWERLRRRYSKEDRRLEFRIGTRLMVEGFEYTIRYDDRPGLFYVRSSIRDEEVSLRGSCASGCGKPYVYAGDLQDALDLLAIRSVMED